MVKKLSRPLLLVGCGKMGEALLMGWLESDYAAAGIIIVSPVSGDPYKGQAGVSVYHCATDIPDDVNPQAVIFATKPVKMPEILPDYRRFVHPDCLFISVAAGKTISFFENTLGKQAAIMRAMPNTPCAIRQGISVICPNQKCKQQQRSIALGLLSAIGEVVLVEDESLLDAVTALSGGGPAYVFWMIEAMAKAGVDVGLPEELATRLSLVTVAGASQLALKSKKPPDQLRAAVTSPGGTTIEALDILMSETEGLGALMGKAITAATNRGREMAKEP